MPYAEVADLRIYYEWHGDENAEPLLLLSGAFGVIDGDSDWGKALPLFAQHYRVLIYEHRGHGRTANPSGEFQGYKQFADDAAGLMRAVGLEKAHIVGFSDGGITALRFAYEYPEMTSDLVTVSINYKNDESNEKGLETLRPDFIESKYPEWAATLERQHGMQGKDYWKELADKLYPIWVRNDLYLSIEEIAKIKAPTLVMSGQYDPYGHIDQTVDIHRAIAGSEICILPGVGHGITQQRSDIVVAIILDYLARQRRRRAKAHRPGA
jgi:pimeloyl-ACP methyl ester carboxylesterase